MGRRRQPTDPGTHVRKGKGGSLHREPPAGGNQSNPPAQLLRSLQRCHGGRNDELHRKVRAGGRRLFLQPQHPPQAGIRHPEGGEQEIRQEPGDRVRRLRLRRRQLVQADQGDGVRCGTRKAVHGVLRHADGTHGPVCTRERLRRYRYHERHLPVEGRRPGRRIGRQGGGPLRRPRVLVPGLANRRHDPKEVPDLGGEQVLQAGILWLLPFPAGFQRLAKGQRNPEDTDRGRARRAGEPVFLGPDRGRPGRIPGRRRRIFCPGPGHCGGRVGPDGAKKSTGGLQGPAKKRKGDGGRFWVEQLVTR
mmetsp:Transcript_25450/g.52216  ORF Transcript_25450/g.52216 Transcript_25450/m.52216 type:complete len:305 (-) Transcript_25450:466-1380(-)